MKQVLTILGSTGSIGESTLNVVAKYPDLFQVFALAGHHNVHKLAQQCQQFQPKFAVLANEQVADELRQILRSLNINTEVLHGKQALIDIATAHEVTGVMCAIVGAAGLPSALAAAQASKTIYLANKETLVVAGALFMQTAQQHHAKILPIDSEHNAIFQVLPATFQAGQLMQHGISSLILTASGGPFLNTEYATLEHITPEQAVKHPNWSMGHKISVDSATMMNKGLELIEAHWLFGASPQQLEVVVHPQSVIHSMVRYLDGSVLAQLGQADMRIPIAHCLGLPHRIESGAKPLDFAQLSALTFQQPDFHKFPCLKLAYDVMHTGGFAPCILNAANEEAVSAFLAKRIKFTDIAAVIHHCLEHEAIDQHITLDNLLNQDKTTRKLAQTFIQQH